MASSKSQTIILWIISFFLMATLAIYQRLTGPTYPINGTIHIDGSKINYSLPRSWGGNEDAKIKIPVGTNNISGTITYRRYKSHDNWKTTQMFKEGNFLVAIVPHQPPAGKVSYYITIDDGNSQHKLTEEPVIIRFKGEVPFYFMIPHIVFMFLAMVFSNRTFFEALFKRNNTSKLALWTLILLFIGGGILGPIIQYYAFGAIWTGWPFGHDLTDNKTLIAMLFWVIAVIRTKKYPMDRKWVLIAGIILVVVYLIPHSLLGSELDYTKAAN